MKKKQTLSNGTSRTQQEHNDSGYTLTDENIVTNTVDRRSFLAKAMSAGSLGVGAAMTAACPSGSDGSDSDSDSQ